VQGAVQGAGGVAGERPAGRRGGASCTCARAIHSSSEASLPIRAVPYEYLRKLSIMPCAARRERASRGWRRRTEPARCASWPPG
jgi:hypothetical protein